MKNSIRWFALVLAAAAASAYRAGPDTAVSPSDSSASLSSVQSWPKTSQAAAKALRDKYGEPTASTDRSLTWEGVGPWAKVTVHRDGVKDTFPTNHVSYIEQTVRYDVPIDRTNEIENFDPALSVDRDGKTITSRSESEAGNILALNLADEIARGRIDAGQARDEMRVKWDEHLAGKSSPYTDGLRFKPESASRPSSSSENPPTNPAAQPTQKPVQPPVK